LPLPSFLDGLLGSPGRLDCGNIADLLAASLPTYIIVASLPLPHSCGIMLLGKQYETNLSRCGIIAVLLAASLPTYFIVARLPLPSFLDGLLGSPGRLDCGNIADLYCGTPGHLHIHWRMRKMHNSLLRSSCSSSWDRNNQSLS
jgi:hypothetical protein